MQAVTAISAVTVSQNSIGVRGDAEQSGEKSFEATLREAVGAEQNEPTADGATDASVDLQTESVLQGRQALRQRVRRSGEEQESSPRLDATQSVQALLGGLLGDVATGGDVAHESTENMTSEGALAKAVSLVGEITKPAAPQANLTAATGQGFYSSISGAEPAAAGRTETGTASAITPLGEALARSGAAPSSADAVEALEQLVAASGAGSAESTESTESIAVEHDVQNAAMNAVATEAVAENIDNDTDEGAAQVGEAPSSQGAPYTAASQQANTATPGTVENVGGDRAPAARSNSASSMVDAAKAAWQGLEMQRIGRNVAASIQTSHGEIAVVAQVAHGETHMLAELPNSLVSAMSAQVQGELRRELHDNGIRAGEMEFRQNDQEPDQQRRAEDQREEAEHGWS